jgi:PRC-barrel domain protein
MKKFAVIAAVATFVVLTSPTLSLAQGTSQTIATVDVKALTTGYRSTKIVGSDVINENRDTIGKIDDILISRDDHHVYAVISVGGFLGMGSKLVAIQYEQLTPTPDNKGFVLRGATKDSLKALPEFRYTE